MSMQGELKQMADRAANKATEAIGNAAGAVVEPTAAVTKAKNAVLTPRNAMLIVFALLGAILTAKALRR